MPLFFDDFDGAGDELVVIRAAGQRGRIRLALCLTEDPNERFGDGFPIRIDPEQSVVILRGADVAEDTGRGLGGLGGIRKVRLGGEDDIRNGLDRSTESLVVFGGLGPHFEGFGREINFVVFWLVEDARFFVVEAA